MLLNKWAFGATVAAFGLAASLAVTPASAITIGGGDCETTLGTAAGAGDFSTVCGTGGAIENTITNQLTGARSVLTNWSAMSSPYGEFALSLFGPDVSSATFWFLSAANNHDFGHADNAGGNQQVIFTNTEDAVPGTTVNFDASGQTDPFTFFAQNDSDSPEFPNLTFFTDSDLNDENFVHFAILEGEFDGRMEYLLFVEDTRNPDLQDYNDAVVQIVAQIPEPATMALFGAGLLGLGLYRRRRA